MQSGRKTIALALVMAGSLFLSTALAQSNAQPKKNGSAETVKDTTKVTTKTTTIHEEDWSITGPIQLRSADPEEPGELEVKNIFGWVTGHGDDDYSYELELEYGLVENHELILAGTFETLGDGRQEGNGDIELGWHWRLWKEDGWIPAFAMRNYVFFPSGTESSGVDYQFRGLFTKTIVENAARAHANVFLTAVDSDEDEERDFQWKVLLGADHRLNDNLNLIIDYRHESSEEYGHRNNHAVDVGLDWEIDDRQTIGLVTEVGIDGDESGPNVGAKISYILSFGG